MTEVTKYQLFLSTMDLVDRIKKMISKEDYEKIVNEKLMNSELISSLTAGDKDLLRDYFINLDKANKQFYDKSMEIYFAFKKYDDVNNDGKKFSELSAFWKIDYAKALLSR